MEDTFWREAADGTAWRIYLDAEFDVSFDDVNVGEDPREIDEDALWEARLEEPPRAAWKEAA